MARLKGWPDLNVDPGADRTEARETAPRAQLANRTRGRLDPTTRRSKLLAEATEMMTIVTHVRVKEGSEPEWDAAMRERLEAARERRGWVAAELLMPLDRLNKRIIIGTWETRADWEAWHGDEAFRETRKRLEGLESEPAQHWWHEVILDLRR